MRETRTTEFKEKITNTFLKTVSAFSNYDGGEIFFGVDDNGNIKGLPDVKQACLDIENKINDSITPQPDYTLELQNNDRTIKLTVKSGRQKPYLYKSKAYKRNDTATIEVDILELSRLILEGKNIKFEELPCKDQELTFNTLCQKLKECIQIETFNQDNAIYIRLSMEDGNVDGRTKLESDSVTSQRILLKSFVIDQLGVDEADIWNMWMTVSAAPTSNAMVFNSCRRI